MSSVVISGDTSGTCTLQAPAVAGSTVLTLPAQTGTVMVNGPAFSAYQSVAQSLTLNTSTKLSFNTKTYDTNTNYDTTNYRFTPTVAGYYQINGAVQFGGAVASGYLMVYKNGAVDKYGSFNGAMSSTIAIISVQIYLNGSTDYIELYANVSASGSTSPGTALNYFQAFLARSA
jgi:hypothetical protein